MIIRSNFPKVLDPTGAAYRVRFFEVLQSVQGAVVPQLFHVRGSVRPDDSIVTLSDVAAPDLRNEAGAIATKEFQEIRTTTFTHLQYAGGGTMSDRAFRNMPDDMKSNLPFLYGRAAAWKREDLGAAVMRTGFTTLGTDGKTLFADDHPMADGGTLDNKGTTALSAAAIGAGRAQMALWQSEMGRVEGSADPQFLVVPPALAVTALAAAQAGASLAVLSVTDANVIAQMGLKVLSWNFLNTDVTDWFLMVDPATLLYGLEYWVAQDEDFMSGFDGEGRYYWFNSTMEFSAGWVSPRCGFGAAVAG